MSLFNILFLLWLLMKIRAPSRLLVVHLNFLIILRELVRGLVSGGGGGLWEGSVSLGGRGDTGRPGPGAPALRILNVLHGHELLQRLWCDFLKRLHVRFHLLQVPLEFGPAVLKPGDDLRVGESQLLRDLVTVGRREVLLVQKPLLQLVNLVVGEGRPRLSPFLRRLPLSEGVEMLATLEEKETRERDETPPTSAASNRGH